MKKYKILLVDDSPEWLRSHLSMLDQLFEKEEIEVETADNAWEGISKFKAAKEKFDLVITDLEMEMVEGFSCAGEWLLHELSGSKLYKGTKFLTISARYNIAQIASKYDSDYIHKSDLLANPLLFKYKVKSSFE